MTSSSALCTFAGRPVDLVGEQEVGEDRPERDLELPRALVVDARADDVRGHQVRGELDPLELAADRLRERLDRHRLGEPGDALDEQVPAGQQRDEHALQQAVLAHDRLLDLVERGLERQPGVGCRDPCCLPVPRRRPALFLLLLGPAGGAAGGGDRDGEADPDEEVLVGRVGQGGDDADHLARPVEQRAAAVAGVDRRVELDQAPSAGPRGAVIVRSTAETTPAVRLRCRPSGLPTAKTASPTGGGPASTAGTTTSGQPVDGQHRDVVLGPAGRHRGGRPRAVGELDLDPRPRRRRRAGP